MNLAHPVRLDPPSRRGAAPWAQGFGTPRGARRVSCWALTWGLALAACDADPAGQSRASLRDAGEAQEGGQGQDRVPCGFQVNAELSPAIATVGIVEWATDLAAVTRARIEFGLEGAGFPMVAPVELRQGSQRTLLLGMKAERRYEFRVIAESDVARCVSDTFAIDTGPVDNSVPVISRDVRNAAAVAPGFIVLVDGLGRLEPGGEGPVFGSGGGTGGVVYVVDADGDPVWWATAPNNTSRARMDWEGQNMLMLALNVGNAGGAAMRRVSMDGMLVESELSGLQDAHHDFTVLPGGIIAALAWSAEGSERPSTIIERSPDGSVRSVATLDQSYYRSENFHANSILYHPADDSYTVGDRTPSLFVKLSRAGELLWQLGGVEPVAASFAGDVSWFVNHGHHLTDAGTFLVFNNNGSGAPGAPPLGAGTTSLVFELALDEVNMVATKLWEYDGGEASPTLGDVQRLPNGNTLVTYSNTGIIHELDAQQDLVSVLTTDGSLGYSDHRPTLYGPPPR